MKAFIIQARLGSTRMPNKIILPFYQKWNILQLLIQKLSQFTDIKIIVATTNNSKDDPLVQLLEQNYIDFFRGEENDVLQRFIDAASYYNISEVIRICSDNPFLDTNAIHELIDLSSNTQADYVSFWVNGKPSIKTHFGFWAEYVTLLALKKTATNTTNPLYREHVTNYIYENPNMFNVKWINTPYPWTQRNDIRLTIDTISDFKRIKTIYETLSTENNLTIDKIISYLDAHPVYLEAMKKEINLQKK